MYLKSIEIHGFKSFANKMIFEFRHGITAIVGPNGSGKSNVADAVRWVLGEQSAKQLRGARMEDVIFSGTEARKPLGYAYVSITFDNTDHKLSTSYDEVTVARRVYRSGESEYLINGNACRLKDVQELFLDTGIGKEGYSIIGQGQIDKILSGKPEERRELFDEAAGIVKFKKRKLAAEKNLEAERQNLCRINDILSEIERQISPMEKQAQIAKEYLKDRDKLKVFDVNLFLMEYKRLHDVKLELEDKLSVVNGDLDDTKLNYENTKEEYETLERQLEEENQKLESKKNQINESKVKKEQLEGQMNVLQEKILFARQTREQYKERMEVLKEQKEQKEQQKHTYVQEKKKIEQEKDSFAKRKREEEEKLDDILKEIIQLEKEIDSGKHELMEYLNKNTELQTKMQRYHTILEQDTIKKTGLNQRILKKKSDEAAFDEVIVFQQENLTKLAKKLENVQEENGKIQEDIKKRNQIIEQYELEVSQKQKESIRESSKLDSLKNITERYDGYNQSIRRIMEQKEKQPGIIGVVADIIKVKKEYETAIEIALGGSIQNIVTDNEITAKQLISFLKQNKYGRATFLPLTSITSKNSFYQEAALKEVGVIGLANTLVEVNKEHHAMETALILDKKFHLLMEYLLGRILVVDHMDHAIAINKKYNNSLRIVTLEGELLNPGGSISGGAYKNSSNLLGRRREIEEIETVIKKIAIELEEKKKQIVQEKEERNRLITKLEEKKQKIQEYYLQQNTAKLKYEQAVAEKQVIQEGYLQINLENAELENQIQELKNNVSELELELEKQEQKRQENERKVAICQEQLAKKKEKEQQIKNQVSSLHLEFSSFEQKNQFIEQNITRMISEIELVEKEKRELDNNLLESKSQMQQRDYDIKSVQNTIKELEDKINQTEEEIELLNKKKEDITKTYKGFFQKREELSNRIIELERETSRLNNQMERLKEQIEHQMNYMWDEYELTYQGAYALRTETELTLVQIKKHIQDLKAKIKALGQVNVNAIEEYKNLSERYELLKAQHEDLICSEQVLREMIEELDHEMRKQFEKKFKEIKQQFDFVFKELFGGGKGTLELMEEEDILTAGILIIAQPPGKKLQNMMQLSGGEKALTAISLLFAIQNLKPSPFCLLDEIEAALDDSNVGRYAQYLHKLTKDTQFIVITHRRGTMKAADILYGITMQEKGVSTLVSVNLIEEELEESGKESTIYE